jgi:hypothetical protein
MDQNFILPLPFQLRNYQEIKSVKNYQPREKIHSKWSTRKNIQGNRRLHATSRFN